MTTVNARFIGSSLWILYFVAVHLRWKADRKGEGVAVRKELLRQGTLIKHAWAWAIIPSFVGVGRGPLWLWAIFVVVAIRCSISCWRGGGALVRQGND